MGEAELKRARNSYLFSCGLALVAALVGITVPAVIDTGGDKPRLELVLVGLAAVGIFLWVAAGARRSDPDSPVPQYNRSAGRLRKMSFLWLALAAALGVSVMRGPVAALLDGTVSQLPSLSWLGFTAGLAIAAVALWRFAAALRARKRNE
ncbi:MAG: hypothetical protein JRF63_06210 [Deltaproteobacteria bacterium]|nr:hypothetical protein [Deltaproteobacteria bacterium]